MEEVSPIKGLSDLANEAGRELEVEENIDPFSPEHAPGLSLIVLMRIYDVLMASLRVSQPQTAKRLVELHGQGKVIGPMPYLDMEE